MAIFNGLSDLRVILDTETDDESVVDEELMSQIRENIEVLLQLLVGRVHAGTLTSDPPNDSTGYLIDTAAGFSDDEHNGRSVIFLDGNAKGDVYTIDDTDSANNRCECTGDNLYSAGARSGDSYLIVYDVKVNTDGHDHDGVNSKLPPTGWAGAILTIYEEITDTITTGGTYEEQVWCRFYLPKGCKTVKCNGSFKSGDTNQATVRVTIYDQDDATAQNTKASSASHNVYQECDIDVDVSGLNDDGWGWILIEFTNANSSSDVFLRRFAATL